MTRDAVFTTRPCEVSAMILGVALLALTGCSADGGYMLAGNEDGSICTPEAEDGSAVFSHHSFTNENSTEPVLAGIEQRDPHNPRRPRPLSRGTDP